MPGVVVATYNVHGGVDGWGRPFDVVAACRAVDADVLVLQESWGPDGGRSVAQRVADELGYRAEELTLARGRVTAAPDGSAQWGPPLWARTPYGIRLDRRHRHPPPAGSHGAPTRAGAPEGVVRGTWGIALLTRLDVRAVRTVVFAQLPADPARRGAIGAELSGGALGGRSLHVVGTHLPHLSQGSPRHFAALRRAVRDVRRGPAVLAGDMNLWGPAVSALLPGWARAARGRSWPTWSPVLLAQTDHVLVTPSLRVRAGAVVRLVGSDHCPVRAEVELR